MKALLKAVACFSLLALAASAARAEDRVRYLDPATKKEMNVTGTILSETPAGLKIKPTIGSAREVPAGNILEVDYTVPGRVILDYRTATSNDKAAESATTETERRKDRETALAAYKKVLAEVSDAKGKQNIEFRIAKLVARQAEDDPTQLEAAIDQLARFTKAYPDSWQVSLAARLLAQLQASKKDYAGAQQTYQDLAKIPGIGDEIIQESQIKAAEMMVRSKKYADAKELLTRLSQKLKPDDPQAVRLRIALAECQAAEGQVPQAVQTLEAILAQPLAGDLKAAAYNTLGDCYLAEARPKDALWNYLYVDVIYHQNREEHAKALYHLYKIFKEQGDEKKAQEFRDRLEKDKRFAGLEYQKLLPPEK